MNNATPQPVTLTSQQNDRFISGWAVSGLLLLLSLVVLSWAVVLSGERGSRCLMYSEQCSAVLSSALYTAFFLALLAGITALVWPRGRGIHFRAWTVFVQWGALTMLGVLILSGA
ncbi:hypothetical protein AB0942_07085 [Streptomyces nodosus]|uniref:hypothetical protein n=1 Tax=Streptomyces nodosus TaxID=40318 RepID=UPI0034572ABF